MTRAYFSVGALLLSVQVPHAKKGLGEFTVLTHTEANRYFWGINWLYVTLSACTLVDNKFDNKLCGILTDVSDLGNVLID